MAVDLNQEIKNFDLKQWLSFEGRIGRQTWWLQYVCLPLAIGVAINIVITIIGFIDFTGGFITLVLSLLWTLVALAFLWPAFAGYAKRLHDRDMSGWWSLIALTGIGGFVLLIICGFLKGTTGPNRFGSDPLGGNPVFGGGDQATVMPPRR